VMASLQRKGQAWYCQFLYQKRRFTYGLGPVDEMRPKRWRQRTCSGPILWARSPRPTEGKRTALWPTSESQATRCPFQCFNPATAAIANRSNRYGSEAIYRRAYLPRHDRRSVGAALCHVSLGNDKKVSA
jgi:hypothetical protein